MKYVVTINDKSYEVDVEKGVAQVLSVVAAAPVKEQPAAAVPVQDTVKDAQTPPAVQPQVQAAAGDALTAPMPGTVVSVLKKVGDKVRAGETVLILEAMKMENEVVAIADGVITQVLVSQGSSVSTGELLVMVQ